MISCLQENPLIDVEGIVHYECLFLMKTTFDLFSKEEFKGYILTLHYFDLTYSIEIDV